MRLRVSDVFAVALLANLAAARVGAQAQDDAAITAAARTLAVDGVKLAQSGQCTAAIDKLERAEKLHHAPIVLARLGECYVQEGRLVEGVESLRSVLREPLPANPSETLQQAYAHSKTLLEATRPKLATLTVSLEPMPNLEPTVTVDDRPVPSALLGAGRPTDPGEHLIRASAAGYLILTRRITLDPGEEQKVVLGLVLDPTAALADSGGASRSAARSRTQQPETLAAPATPLYAAPPTAAANHWPAYITWGVSAVSLGIGVGFGVAAINNRSDLRALCPTNACGAQQRDLLDAAHLNATISTVGVGVGIAGAALGAALYFLLGETDSAHRDLSQPERTRLMAQTSLTGTNLSFTF